MVEGDFGFDGVHLPEDFPFAVGTLGAEDEVAARERVRSFGFIFGDDGDLVGAVLANGVGADVSILRMEFDRADGTGGKVVTIEAFDRFAAGKGGKAGGHESAIFGEEGSQFNSVAFFGGEDPAVAEVGEDVGVGGMGDERKVREDKNKGE